MKTPQLIGSLCIGAAVLVSATNARAAVYASGFTNVVNGTTTNIGYWLNATPASGMLQITTFPSGTHPANIPATPAQGSNSFVLPTGDTSYTVTVTNTGTGTPSAENIAAANSANTAWTASPDPRGMDVNCFPGNGPTFGMVYATCGGAGTGHGLGLFPTHSDMSYALGANSAGLDSATFSGAAVGSAPYKINASRYDGSVMVSVIDPTVGTIYLFDPYLKTATQLLPKGNNTTGLASSPYHGEIYGAPKSTGSLAQGNFVLYTFDYTMPTPSAVNSTFGGLAGAIGLNAAWYNSNIKGTIVTFPGTDYENLNRYTIGGSGSLPVASLPDLTLNYGSFGLQGIAALPGDIEVAPDGKLFTTSERNAGTTAPYISVYDPTGATNLFYSQASASDDVVRDKINATGYDAAAQDESCLIRVSPDDKFVALMGYYGYIAIFSLTNGVPDISSFTFIGNQTNSGTARGVAWDCADNVYTMASSTGNLNIYDIGQTAICTSGNDVTGTNGTFTRQGPPAASVAPTTPIGYQANNSYNGNLGSPTPAVFTITLTPAPSVATTVNFTLTGTAANGVNYTTTPTSVAFPAGISTETVSITPTATPAVGPTLSVILTLSASGTYGGTPTATAYIANSGEETLTLSAGAATMYRGLPNDFVSYTISRQGDTNKAFTIPLSAFTMSGQAVFGTDYTSGPQNTTFTNWPTSSPSGGIYFAPGALTGSVEVGSPLPHATYTGNLTVTMTGNSGTSVPEGVPFAFTGSPVSDTLIDNLPAQPEINVLWSDALSANDSTNWTATFSQDDTNPPLPGPLVFSNYNGTPTVNFFADFGYPACLPNYDGVDLPPNGSTTVLRVTANKGSGSSQGCGVNLYPENCPILKGNYSVRFNMNLVRGCNSGGGSEYCVFGINHYGTNVNWIWDGAVLQSNSPTDVFSFTNSDGIWFSVASDPLQFGNVGASPNSYPSDYVMCTATNGNGANKFFPSTGYWPLNGASSTSFINVFKQTVDYTSFNYDISNAWGYPLVGVPANQSGWYGAYDGGSVSSCPASGGLPTNGSWTDVEIRQSNNVVTLFLNGTTIFTYNNVTPFTNGYPMLGYYDPYVNEGVGGGVYYSDIRAVELGAQFAPAPVAATVGAGTNYTSTIGAIGTGPFTNVWYASVGNVPLFTNTVASGADSGSYTFVSPTANISYYVVVSDASGSVTSSVVTLTVQQPASITTGPSPVTIYAGGKAVFNVTAAGAATLAYQWTSNTVNLANGGIVAGATSAALTLTGVPIALNGGTYGVIVTNAYGKATNTGALLTVLPPNPSLISSFLAATNGVKLGFYTTAGDTNDTTNSFFVQSSTNLSSPVDFGFTNLTNVTITVTGGTNFSVTVPTNSVDQTRYYRIQHKPY